MSKRDIYETGVLKFTAIPGGGDMVAALEEALADVKAGRLEGIVICGIWADKMNGWTWAHTDGAEHAWSRLIASTATAYHELLSDGLEP